MKSSRRSKLVNSTSWPPHKGALTAIRRVPPSVCRVRSSPMRRKQKNGEQSLQKGLLISNPFEDPKEDNSSRGHRPIMVCTGLCSLPSRNATCTSRRHRRWLPAPVRPRTQSNKGQLQSKRGHAFVACTSIYEVSPAIVQRFRSRLSCVTEGSVHFGMYDSIKLHTIVSSIFC